MPSPFGHALGAVAVGWAIARPATGRRALGLQVAALAALGTASDLDLLWGRHSQETHSLGAALIAAVAALAVRTVTEGSYGKRLAVRTANAGSYEHSWFARTLGVRTTAATFLLVAAVWFSHPLMDAFGADSSPPLGVMLFWPFSHDFWIAPFALFDAISRMWWRDDVWTHNFAAAGREVLLLAPVVALVWWTRRQRGLTVRSSSN